MNYRPTRGAVAAEAFPFALAVAFITIAAFALNFTYLGLIFLILLVFVIAFFRNPERYHKPAPGAVISGADGKIVAAGLMQHPDFPGGQCLRIAIFMNVFNCHINWAPVAGRVLAANYCPGKFMNAHHDKCGDENERKVLAMETESGHRVEVKLIAGLIARRIVCPVDSGDTLKQGEKIGLIRFGSRVEVLVPAQSSLHVRPGMMVRGGETIIATLPESTLETNPNNA